MAKLFDVPALKMFLIQTVFVFLFAFVMLSETVYKVTDETLSPVLGASLWEGKPTDVGLAIHAGVYVLFVFMLSTALKMSN
jgi:hypothetical protein